MPQLNKGEPFIRISDTLKLTWLEFRLYHNKIETFLKVQISSNEPHLGFDYAKQKENRLLGVQISSIISLWI